MTPRDPNPNRTGYSQNDEEKHILAYFRRNMPPIDARFLDIGAHDGVTFSNTRALAEGGWGGVLVEPSPTVFPALLDNYRGRADVSLVNVALVPGEPRLVKFYDSNGDMVSTVDEKHREVWSKDIHYKPIYVAATNVDALLEMFPGPYHFINLDVEGINHELFCDLPLRNLGTMLVCVEYQDKFDFIQQFAEQHSYDLIHKTGENALFALRGSL